MPKVNLAEKLAQFDSHWDPHIVARYNNNDVMVVKVKGEFPFHVHEDTDDFFFILSGEVFMDYENGASDTLVAGDVCVVPKGVTHRPRAVEEAQIMLIEPIGEPNTGDAKTAAPKPTI